MKKCKQSDHGKCSRTYKRSGFFTSGWYDPCDGTEEDIANCSFWNGKQTEEGNI